MYFLLTSQLLKVEYFADWSWRPPQLLVASFLFLLFLFTFFRFFSLLITFYSYRYRFFSLLITSYPYHHLSLLIACSHILSHLHYHSSSSLHQYPFFVPFSSRFSIKWIENHGIQYHQCVVLSPVSLKELVFWGLWWVSLWTPLCCFVATVAICICSPNPWVLSFGVGVCCRMSSSASRAPGVFGVQALPWSLVVVLSTSCCCSVYVV